MSEPRMTDYERNALAAATLPVLAVINAMELPPREDDPNEREDE